LGGEKPQGGLRAAFFIWIFGIFLIDNIREVLPWRPARRILLAVAAESWQI